ncbi:MAG TPA: hypothetical protein VFJ62_06240 [Usitatibacter sp.]|nr:hypothetical protein [Usitatibacter sp.]
MPHVFEPAASGRSTCRGCGRALERGELRFGERLPNPFAEGTELTLWFHPACAAYKRPQSLLEALASAEGIDGRDHLERIARAGLEHARLPRLDGAERARGQASCRGCREPIVRGSWRIRLVFFEEGRFHPAGFVHLACGRAYFECEELAERLFHFSPGLDEAERAALQAACEAPAA